MNSNWKECKLGNVAEFKNGKSRPSEIVNGAIPIYGGNGILGYTDTFNYQGETVIVGRVGAYCGSVFFENKPIWVSDNALYTIPKNETDAKFLYYLLKSMGLNSQAEGSSHPLLTQTLLNSLDVFVTDSLPEQRAIAGVLSSLDNKIVLLYRQNKTLEGMAEAIYRHFFVDNRKATWRECTVSELADHEKTSIHANRNPNTLFYHYSIPAFDDSQMPVHELGALIQSNKYKVLKDTILFSKLNPHKDKRVWLVPSSIAENSVCSTEFQVMNPKAEKYLFFLYGFIFHPENYDEIAAGVGGTSSSHQRIDPEVIFKFKCFLPDDTTLINFNEIIEPIFGKMQHNRKSIQTLIHQRDTLLPKLMSGEVRVKL